MAEALYKQCVAENCERNAHHASGGRKGYCNSHRKRLMRHGDINGGGTGTGEAAKWLKDHVAHRGQDCLSWPYSRNIHGYGQINMNGAPMLASRLMCIMAHGEPELQDMEAAHSCGKGSSGCVNPLHLSWKTTQDNERDKIEHGTTNRGERHGCHKLTEDQVRLIRKTKGTVSSSDMAMKFGVSSSTVDGIRAMRTWAWLSEERVSI